MLSGKARSGRVSGRGEGERTMAVVRNGTAAVCTMLGLLCASVALGALSLSVALDHNASWLAQVSASPTTNILGALVTPTSGSSSLLADVEHSLGSLVGGGGSSAASSALQQLNARDPQLGAQLQQAATGAAGPATHGASSAAGAKAGAASTPGQARLAADVAQLPTIVHRIGTLAVALAALLVALAFFVSAERHRVLRRVARYALIAGAFGLLSIYALPRIVHHFAHSGTLAQLGTGVTAGSTSMVPEFAALVVLGIAGLVVAVLLTRQDSRRREDELVTRAKEQAPVASEIEHPPPPPLSIPADFATYVPPGTPGANVSLHL